MATTNLTQKEIKAQIKILESLKIDFYDEREGLGGTYGHNYVCTKQIYSKIQSLKKKIKKQQ